LTTKFDVAATTSVSGLNRRTFAKIRTPKRKSFSSQFPRKKKMNFTTRCRQSSAIKTTKNVSKTKRQSSPYSEVACSLNKLSKRNG
jgi:hypothetical protein